MRIDAGMASFYNASSSARVQSAGNVNAASKVSSSQNTAGASSNGNSASQYLSEHGGVIQTRVSSASSYQKAMLDNPRSIAENMASKLMGKLPNILRDMQNLSSDGSGSVSSAASANGNASNKVVITEANAGAGSNGAGSFAGSNGSSGAAAGAMSAMADFSL